MPGTGVIELFTLFYLLCTGNVCTHTIVVGLSSGLACHNEVMFRAKRDGAMGDGAKSTVNFICKRGPGYTI